MKDRFEYIKQNILDSELNTLFDLANIDWVECDRFAQTHFVVEASKLYNNGLFIYEIANTLKCARSTIRRWLKQAANIGLCDYDPSNIQKRHGLKVSRPVNIYTMDRNFIQTFLYRRVAGDFIEKTESQVKLATETKKHICGDYLVFNADDPTQSDPTKIIPNKMIKEE